MEMLAGESSCGGTHEPVIGTACIYIRSIYIVNELSDNMHCIIGGLREVSASYAWMEWLTSVESWLGLTCLHELVLRFSVKKRKDDGRTST